MLVLAAWVLAARGDTCTTYADIEQSGVVTDSPIVESSGVAASRTRPGVWFTHNDDDGAAALYAFRTDGTYLEEHEVRGAEVEDWEDMSAAPCPNRGDCLYIADTGDNDLERDFVAVYAVREPDEGKPARVVERWVAVYPDGPHDSEALLVHPCTGQIQIISKVGDGIATVYGFPRNGDGGTQTLESVATLQIFGSSADRRVVTGADWDLDGDRVVVRTPDTILEWEADPERPNAHWSEPPRVLPAMAAQLGEGVAYGLDGSIVTTSEGNAMPVAVSECEELEPAFHLCEFPQTGGCGCSTPARPGGAAALLTTGLLILRRRR